MPEEKLSAPFTKLKEDKELRQRLNGAGDLDAAVAIAKEAGFDVKNRIGSGIRPSKRLS